MRKIVIFQYYFDTLFYYRYTKKYSYHDYNLTFATVKVRNLPHKLLRTWCYSLSHENGYLLLCNDVDYLVSSYQRVFGLVVSGYVENVSDDPPQVVEGSKNI